MPKMYVLTLGYETYGVKPADMPKVLVALEALHCVKRRHYTTPYYLAGETHQQPTFQLVDVSAAEPPKSEQEIADEAAAEERRQAREAAELARKLEAEAKAEGIPF